jgi:3,4-dihydroxy-9,10-secoandrosta-1,3,5(10)-triene-9,17-dione 4,5-dioxygenase
MISSLGYLRISATDTAAWREFGTRVLGMTEGRGPEEGAVYLRMDHFPARLVIVPGDENRLLASGWEVASPSGLAAVARALSEAGVPFKGGSDEELDARRIGGLLTLDDPAGNTLEIFAGSAYESKPALGAYGTRFVTGDQGMGHVVLPVPAVGTETFDFYTSVLGFRLRDSMRMPAAFFGLPEGSPPVWFRFLGCCPRHHSLALAPMQPGERIIHLMVEVATIDDVGLAMERCAKRGAPIHATLGRHVNDRMVSFYVTTPGGFDVEYGYDGLQVDDATWVARESTAVSVWGHSFL